MAGPDQIIETYCKHKLHLTLCTDLTMDSMPKVVKSPEQQTGTCDRALQLAGKVPLRLLLYRYM